MRSRFHTAPASGASSRASSAILLSLLLTLSPIGSPSAHGGAAGAYQKVSFQQLKRYKPGRPVPPEVGALNGKKVEILGFMAALTQLEGIDEFILASSPPLNCYCAPPLFINEVISVKITGKPVRYKAGVVKVRGTLVVNSNIKDEFSDVMYTLRADGME